MSQNAGIDLDVQRREPTLRAAIAFGIVTLAFPTVAQTAEKPLSTMTNGEEGEYLVDGSGMSLYLFKADSRGTDGKSPTSACNDAACTGTWPPLFSEVPVADSKLDKSMLGTFKREDKTTQITYNGWPLYYYMRMPSLETSSAMIWRASARIGT